MSRQRTTQPPAHGATTQPAPASSRRRRGASPGNANALRHGLYSAHQEPDAGPHTDAPLHPERSGAQSKDAPAAWVAEENENIEEQFPFPAPTPPAHDAPADTRHASPLHPTCPEFPLAPSFPSGIGVQSAIGNRQSKIPSPLQSFTPDDPDEPIVGVADAVYGFEAHVARVTAQVHAAARQAQDSLSSGRTGESYPPVTKNEKY